MTTKDRLHELVNGLPDTVLLRAERLLEGLSSKGSRLPASLRDAPWDDEPVAAEEADGDREAWNDLHAGRVVSHDEARRRLLGGR